MPLLKQERAQGKVAFFRHTKFIIRGAVSAVGGATDGNVVVEAAGAWAGATVDSSALPSQPNAPRIRSRARPLLRLHQARQPAQRKEEQLDVVLLIDVKHLAMRKHATLISTYCIA